jgi:hypothetical protein
MLPAGTKAEMTKLETDFLQGELELPEPPPQDRQPLAEVNLSGHNNSHSTPKTSIKKGTRAKRKQEGNKSSQSKEKKIRSTEPTGQILFVSCHGGQLPLANERPPSEDSTSGCTTERPPSEDSTSGCTTERPPSEDSTSGCTTEDHLPSEKPRPKESDFICKNQKV